MATTFKWVRYTCTKRLQKNLEGSFVKFYKLFKDMQLHIVLGQGREMERDFTSPSLFKSSTSEYHVFLFSNIKKTHIEYVKISNLVDRIIFLNEKTAPFCCNYLPLV